jgi:peptidoglycan/xylan/chitin deacetylase (PgdA/CDA1 family)
MKRTLLIVVALAAITIAGVATTAFAFPRPMVRGLSRLWPSVTFYVITAQPVVALTIDDGPDRQGTPAILDVLEKNNARATFFLIGARAAGNERLLARIQAGHHEIANHTFREKMSLLVPTRELSLELQRTHEVVSPYGEVAWFRPGSALFSRRILDLATERGYRTALGDIFPFDSWIPHSGFHSWYVLRHVRPGSIIVLHDANGRGQRTAATLRFVLPELKARGFRVVTLSELVALRSSRG